MTEHLDKALEAVTTMDLTAIPPGAKPMPGWLERHWKERVAEVAQKLTAVRDEMNKRAERQDSPDIVSAVRIDLLNDALLSLENYALPDDEINTGKA